MFSMILTLLLTAPTLEEGPGRSDAMRLVKTIESLQKPIDDFRCEFEGEIRYKGKVAEGQKLGDDGLSESFSGIFIWKRGGDTRSESLHRDASTGQIARESLVVRISEQKAEEYHRLDDAPLGYAVIKNPKEVNSWKPNCLGYIFLIDKIKRQILDENLEPSVDDGQIEGHPLKVLNLAIKAPPTTCSFSATGLTLGEAGTSCVKKAT